MEELNRHKILIVDDDDFTREMYLEVFRNSGYAVFEAKDGVEGLDVATRELPEVIFTGIVMPRMDGFSLIEALKKNTATAKTIIFVSSHLGREEDRQHAEQLGARDFIVRDMTSPNEVVDLVTRVFSEGGEYVIQFDMRSLDAQKLAQGIGLTGGFQCMSCNESMLLKIRVDRSDRNWYKAKFVCPKCGWQNP